MLARILTGVIGIPFAFAVVFWPNGKPFAVVIGFVAVVGVMEFYHGLRQQTRIRPIEWVGVIAVVMFIISATSLAGSNFTSILPAVLTLLFVLSFCVEFIRTKRAPIENVGTTVFGAMYVGWFISHMVALRWFSGKVMLAGTQYAADTGACLVMLIFLATWACDTGAFAIGRKWGKHKMAPLLSPNKTMEGAAGGLVSSIVLAMLCGWLIHMPWYHTLALGIIFGVFSQLGDLSESAIKRELGIKDFGKIVPGHGGILDRFDSVLFTGPAAFYYIVIFMQEWLKRAV